VTESKPVDLGGDLDAAALARVAHGRARADVSADARARMRPSETALDAHVAEGRRIYGVTTGYGPLAGYRVAPEDSAQLQRGLIDHLASGVGPPLPREAVRAMMAARVSSLARGWSGVRAGVADQLTAMLNADVVPEVPEAGTVGASGDLTPLAHTALAAIGEGRVLGGANAADALAAAGVEPLTLMRKDGLALVNGTAAMTGIAALNTAEMANAVDTALRLTVLHAEVLGGRRDAFDPRLGAARPHAGQQRALDRLNALMADSGRLHAAEPVPPRLSDVGDGEAAHQDAYTIRCAPQEFGAALDALDHHERVVTSELHSATDNPLIDPETGHVLHGGNFYGQHIAYASDMLASVAVKMAAHAERALARLTDTTRNGSLPPFLAGGAPGLNSGFMGAQVSATALLAEMRTHAVPAAIQTIPTNGDNQDVVTMGTIASRTARDQVNRLWRVLAIHALALTQAFELQGGFAPGGGFAASSHTLAVAVRERSDFLGRDRPLSDEIADVAAWLAGGGDSHGSAW